MRAHTTIGVMLACIALTSPSPAGDAILLASPYIYEEADPNYSGLLACEKPEQLQAIVESPDPLGVYYAFYEMPNKQGGPTCMDAFLEYGDVLSSKPTGIMRWEGKHFRTWILEIGIEETRETDPSRLWLLYYEHFTGYDI